MTFSSIKNKFIKQNYIIKKTGEFYLAQLNSPIRASIIGNALFDKVSVISDYNYSKEEFLEMMASRHDDIYTDIFCYFFPDFYSENNMLKNKIYSYVENFKNSIDPLCCADNPILIAERKVKNGTWIAIADDACLILDHIDEVYISMQNSNVGEKKENELTDNMCILSFENLDECSGEDFFSFFHRENPETLELMKKLGLGCSTSHTVV